MRKRRSEGGGNTAELLKLQVDARGGEARMRHSVLGATWSASVGEGRRVAQELVNGGTKLGVWVQGGHGEEAGGKCYVK